MSAEPVASERYTEEYFLGRCGGTEFFDRYGARVLKPTLAYSLARAGLKPGMRVLDLGCGRGELLFQARGAGARGVGTDYAPPALKLAAKVSGCPVACCDAKALPFADAVFDRVFFIGVVDHLHDWELERCFAELARVLAPGGRVVLHSCVNRWYFKRWTYGARRALARAGRAAGLPVRDPSPPKSDEDETLHVNEHSPADLERFFRRIGWAARAEVRPNYKLEVRELYGEVAPDFPLRPAGRWRRFLHKLSWWPPLSWILARELFCIAAPPERR
ncbi:MAG: class I SAM-dependent methyltransferase [Elusimicrobia bacterium]|nr:class I SAM-dependent methyltransferase [Elusimicrobiota bacterium]